MDFLEAQRRLDSLNYRRRRNELTAQQYVTEINSIQLQDDRGTLWHADPNTGNWLFWNGTSWQPESPPAASVPPYVAGGTNAVPDTSGEKKIMDINSFRQISRTQPWHKRPQKWWDLFSILVGLATAIIWLLYSGLPKTSEGFDWISAFLMVAIPWILVTYRAEIDDSLIPLQPRRRQFSPGVLLGMGIAVPFLTAFILFHVFHVMNYPLVYWNMLIGTAASYALMREPVLARAYQPRSVPGIRVPVAVFLFLTLCVRIVRADHCLQDPLNAQDCARSTGFGEGIAGGTSAVVATGAGGSSVVQLLGQRAGPEADGSTVMQQAAPGGAAAAPAGAGAQAPLAGTALAIDNWIKNTPYLRGTWEIAYDTNGNAIGAQVRGLVKPDGTLIPPVLIPANDLLHYDLYSTPVPLRQQVQTALNVATHVTDDQLMQIGSRRIWRSLTQAQRQQLIVNLTHSIQNGTGTAHTPVSFTAEGGSQNAAYIRQRMPDKTSLESLTINTNSPVYRSRNQLLVGLGHEVRHQVQHSDLPMETPETRQIVDKNQLGNNYVDFKQDPSGYAAQYVERDAQSFGICLLQTVKARIRLLKVRMQTDPALQARFALMGGVGPAPAGGGGP